MRELLVTERDVMMTISVLLIVLYALIRNIFPKVFALNFDFAKLITFRVREEIGYSLKPFSQGQLLLSGIYACTLGFMVLFWGRQLVDIESNFYGLFDFQTFGMGILQWLLISMGLFFLTSLRFLFLLLFSALFNFGSGHQRQFSDFFTSSSCFFLLLSFVTSIFLYGQFVSVESLASLLLRVAAIFLFYRTILIYFKLLQTTAYSKLYIFSYICTTELIPLFIGLKYLIR